jgi:hypothetical protein
MFFTASFLVETTTVKETCASTLETDTEKEMHTVETNTPHPSPGATFSSLFTVSYFSFFPQVMFLLNVYFLASFFL